MDEKQYNHFLEALDEMSKLPERCMPPVIRLKDIEKEVNRLRAATATELFEPGRGRRYRILMKRARRTNEQRDLADRSNGFAAPSDGPPAVFLRNAISAITCGIETEDWSSVAEGLDMLQKAEVTARSHKVNDAAI